MPWKKKSSQSSFKTNKKTISKTYERRMEEAKKMKALKQRVADLRERDRARRVEIAQKTKEKQKRKELNEWKSAKV